MARSVAALLIAMTLAALVQAQTPRSVRETIKYLQELQTKSGGFCKYRGKKGGDSDAPSLRATAAAIRTLKLLGAPIGPRNGASGFIARCHDKKSGGFANRPSGKPDVFSTVVGILAVRTSGMPIAKYQKRALAFLEKNAKSFEEMRIAAAAYEALATKSVKVKKWIEALHKLQNADGTFGKGDGKARLTASAAVAILRLGGALEHRKNIIKALQDGQQLNGGYGKGATPTDAELGSTYRVIRAFHMLKAKPVEVEKVRSFVEKCRHRDGGYGPTPGASSTAIATYFAVMIHSWLKEE